MINEIRRECLDKESTGVIQDKLMELGMTLKEADILINHWYEGKTEDWFDDVR